ncbi:hypothetical protein B0H13DRAFT_2269342 [Mycena leptocephala]|nr:hypothetical protein B0H13DRAFT_2269342 [Mycena leptocephala]
MYTAAYGCPTCEQDITDFLRKNNWRKIWWHAECICGIYISSNLNRQREPIQFKTDNRIIFACAFIGDFFSGPFLGKHFVYTYFRRMRSIYSRQDPLKFSENPGLAFNFVLLWTRLPENPGPAFSLGPGPSNLRKRKVPDEWLLETTCGGDVVFLLKACRIYCLPLRFNFNHPIHRLTGTPSGNHLRAHARATAMVHAIPPYFELRCVCRAETRVCPWVGGGPGWKRVIVEGTRTGPRLVVGGRRAPEDEIVVLGLGSGVRRCCASSLRHDVEEGRTWTRAWVEDVDVRLAQFSSATAGTACSKRDDADMYAGPRRVRYASAGMCLASDENIWPLGICGLAGARC